MPASVSPLPPLPLLLISQNAAKRTALPSLFLLLLENLLHAATKEGGVSHSVLLPLTAVAAIGGSVVGALAESTGAGVFETLGHGGEAEGAEEEVVNESDDGAEGEAKEEGGCEEVDERLWGC